MGVIGTMEAVHGVTVSADLPGRSTRFCSIPASTCMREMFWLNVDTVSGKLNGWRWKRSAIWRKPISTA